MLLLALSAPSLGRRINCGVTEYNGNRVSPSATVAHLFQMHVTCSEMTRDAAQCLGGRKSATVGGGRRKSAEVGSRRRSVEVGGRRKSVEVGSRRRSVDVGGLRKSMEVDVRVNCGVVCRS